MIPPQPARKTARAILNPDEWRPVTQWLQEKGLL